MENSFKTEGSLQRDSRLHEKNIPLLILQIKIYRPKILKSFEKFKDCEDRFHKRIIFVRARKELESLKRVG